MVIFQNASLIVLEYTNNIYWRATNEEPRQIIKIYFKMNNESIIMIVAIMLFARLGFRLVLKHKGLFRGDDKNELNEED